MIEGIDYYPKQGRSKKSKAKFGAVILVLIVIILYYFVSNDGQIPEKSQKNLIVIKEPELEEVKVVSVPVNVENSENEAKSKKPKILENLDEIIQIHQQ